MKQFDVEEETQESPVKGVTWLENKIYVVCRGSNRVHVFPDQEPFQELKEEEIKISDMKQPWDMTASKVSQSIFITDRGERCLWRVQMPGGAISRHEMDGMPSTLYITSSDELIVVGVREDHWYLDIFSCSDVNRKQTIPMSSEIKEVLHAVRSSNGNTVMSFSTKEFPDVYQIGEVSVDGKTFIRTLDPRSLKSGNIEVWIPDHLIPFGTDGCLLVADFRHQQVHLLNSQLTDLQVLLKTYQHQLNKPHRLCFVTGTQHLIVGQAGVSLRPGQVSVFKFNDTTLLTTTKH